MIYPLLMWRLAARPLSELEPGRAMAEALAGLAVGAVFVGGSAGLIALLGGYCFTWGRRRRSSCLTALTVNLGAAVVEELVFRGVAFQALEQLAGRWAALAGTSLFFGLVHLGNPNATPWSALAIACEAGLLLGAAFLWRRHLAFVIGLHFAWNLTETLLGIPVSGQADPGLFKVALAGPELLTGGSFGLEASLVPVLASFYMTLPMLWLARRRESRQAAANSASRPPGSTVSA